MDGASAMTLTALDGQRFRFDAGTLCLDFLLIGAVEPWEQLHEPGDLMAWIGRSRLGVEGDVVAGQGDLMAAERLRGAVQHLAERAARGEAYDSADLWALNEAAAAPPPVPVIGVGLDRGWSYPVTATQFLSAVARDAIELFSGPLVKRVRMCAGELCSLIFLDTSRPGTRRWCSMSRCGNRQKLRTRRS
ncbi:ABATE domain-containing protein [Nonomuraea sp. NPDC048916]|uniref:CGNR zinc finger domain-containing protein n=1 Tax=Nonomuraea sp. NPDC048916 TaxID=3154232 RepID=UPI0033DAE53F